MIQGVTFDCWNTLIYVEDLEQVFKERVKRIQKVLQKAGHHYPQAEIADRAFTVYEIVRDRQYQQGLDFTPEEQVRELLRILKVPASDPCFSEVFTTYTGAVLDAPPKLVDGAQEVLAELAPHFQIGLICNTGTIPGRILRPLIKKFHLAHFFKVQTFSDEELIAKPNTQIFQRTLERLGLSAEVSVHIGDDPLTDIAGARKARMKTIWFNPGHKEESPVCTWQVSSLRQVPSLLLSV